MNDTLLIWGAGLLLFAVLAFPFLRATRRQEREAEEAREEAARYGLAEAVSLHPVVDPAGCIGIGNCVKVCPEGVLVLESGQAAAVRAARCIGHGLCERVCPVGVSAWRGSHGNRSRASPACGSWRWWDAGPRACPPR